MLLGFIIWRGTSFLCASVMANVSAFGPGRQTSGSFLRGGAFYLTNERLREISVGVGQRGWRHRGLAGACQHRLARLRDEAAVGEKAALDPTPVGDELCADCQGVVHAG